ncbi:MAG TPA: hypothetical protein ENO03_03005 [Candidatus Aminicenantes bacterium]|nr:hypothetical protein [Candidatus Aminicenantes bacterium]HDT13306.1 hypothetical protein [Candidatus Aminicenantes bacterium]
MRNFDFKRALIPTVRWLERALAVVVLAGVLVALVLGARMMAGADWSAIETFYELIYRILLLVIGLELVRMLITHSLGAVLELLAFVIARKMLKPDLTAVDIILSVMAFVILLAGRKFLMSRTCYEPDEIAEETAARPKESGA